MKKRCFFTSFLIWIASKMAYVSASIMMRVIMGMSIGGALERKQVILHTIKEKYDSELWAECKTIDAILEVLEKFEFARCFCYGCDGD